MDNQISSTITKHNSSNSIDISIIIPAYNEANRIPSTLEKVIDFMHKHSQTFEIIVVDDGSTDSTASVVEEFMKKSPYLKILKNERNEGKGNTVKKGVLNAQGSVIFFTDADLSTPIEEIDRFLESIKNMDIVIGSRAIEGANIVISEPFYRAILGKIFCAMVRWFCVPGFVDTQCGAKMFRREAARKIFPLLKIPRFAFDVEVLYLAYRFGCKVKELPVTWYFSPNSRVRTFLDGPKMLWDIIQIRWNHRKSL